MIVYLNGEFLPIEQAKISVLDRGFIYGDGVYELVPVYGRKSFRLPQHLTRLQHSLDGIRLANPHSDAQWTSIIGEIIARQPYENQGVYFQVTRGVAKRDHTFPKDVPPTVFMMSNPLATPSADQVERGVACITAEDNRWRRCDLKTIQLLPNVVAKQRASRAGAYAAILVRDGMVTEGAHTNVFVVQGGVLRTHPAGPGILGGITREIILEIAGELGMPVRDEAVRAAELPSATEVFFTGTTTDVVPVVKLDGKQLGDGRPGPVAARLQAKLRERLDAVVAPSLP